MGFHGQAYGVGMGVTLTAVSLPIKGFCKSSVVLPAFTGANLVTECSPEHNLSFSISLLSWSSTLFPFLHEADSRSKLPTEQNGNVITMWKRVVVMLKYFHFLSELMGHLALYISIHCPFIV